ncbi:transposase [Orientia tsutsugamushi]|uniref:transposase n=1 Tax=Orientia tsutsugamushi TaxID=784 RepID=UPI001CC24564|nr:transposase [Orientia tsutsugamushi]
MHQVLINELKPAQFVVIDNAAFHKSKKTKELIESVGCKVIFLPPYSQDLNLIEKFSANMKGGGLDIKLLNLLNLMILLSLFSMLKLHCK